MASERMIYKSGKSTGEKDYAGRPAYNSGCEHNHRGLAATRACAAKRGEEFVVCWVYDDGSLRASA